MGTKGILAIVAGVVTVVGVSGAIGYYVWQENQVLDKDNLTNVEEEKAPDIDSEEIIVVTEEQSEKVEIPEVAAPKAKYEFQTFEYLDHKWGKDDPSQYTKKNVTIDAPAGVTFDGTAFYGDGFTISFSEMWQTEEGYDGPGSMNYAGFERIGENPQFGGIVRVKEPVNDADKHKYIVDKGFVETGTACGNVMVPCAKGHDLMMYETSNDYGLYTVICTAESDAALAVCDNIALSVKFELQ